MSEPAPPAMCLSCQERLPIRRGLCFRCYDRLGRVVRGGKATWAELEESGQALPAKPRWGRMPQGLRQRPKEGH